MLAQREPRSRTTRSSASACSPRLTANTVRPSVAEHRGRLQRVVGGLDAQHRPAPEARRVRERVERRLAPRGPAVERPDRRDHVDELRQAADLDPVGVAQQRDQQAADDQRVGDGVLVLGQRRRVLERPVVADVVRVGRLMPHVPLVDADLHPLAGALSARDRVGGRDDRVDHAVEVLRAAQVLVHGLVLQRVVVGVQGDIVGDVPGEVEHGVLPVPERRHRGVRGARDAQLDRRVDPAHRLAGLGRQPAVLDRGLLARPATARPSRCPGTRA